MLISRSAFAQIACPPCAGGGFNTLCSPPPFGDAGFEKQWYIEPVRACEAWDLGFTGQGVVVGVCNWGILETHDDLAPEPAGCSEPRPQSPASIML